MTKVLASVFNDKIGMRDNNHGYYYAELSIDPKKKDFKALGGLPFGHKLKITYKKKSVIYDVGAGALNFQK